MNSGRTAYAESRPHGLMFHRFHQDGAPSHGQGAISQSSFEAMLTYVGIDRILSPQEWMERARRGSLRNGDLCLTFDDGLKSAWTIALPIMKYFNIKAFWFIYTSVFDDGFDIKEIFSQISTLLYDKNEDFFGDFEEFLQPPKSLWVSEKYRNYQSDMKSRFSFYADGDIRFRYLRDHYCALADLKKILEQIVVRKGKTITDVMDGIWMSPDDVRQLASDGHVIGLHSHDHPSGLEALPLAEQFHQYDLNKRTLEALVGGRISTMSHPLGSYRPETLSLLKDMGIEIGFRSSLHMKENMRLTHPPLELPRADAADLVV